jgi:hypothetical protein
LRRRRLPESEPIGQAFIASLGLTGLWLQTSYHANFRAYYAGIGYTYDADLNEFVPPPPIEPTRRAVMTSKKISKAKRQIGDQTTKGGLIGLMIYGLNAQGVDPILISMLVPVASSVLAWASTKVGDPDLACLFIPHDDEDKSKS